MPAFIYVPPEIPQQEDGFPASDTKQGNTQPTQMTWDLLNDNFFNSLNKEELLTGNKYQKYKLSIYEEILNVPKYSYVTADGFRNIVSSYCTAIGPRTERPEDLQNTNLYSFFQHESFFF